MKPRPIPISGYDYDLPEKQIARYPLPERDRSELPVYRKEFLPPVTCSHRIGGALPNPVYLLFTGCFILNNLFIVLRR